jgi:hypothetical protein
VDEEGWEYSFFFRGFVWHGTSPWFHSFVRRRRWIRLRRRRMDDIDGRQFDGGFEDEGVFEDEPLEMGDPTLKKAKSKGKKKAKASIQAA